MADLCPSLFGTKSGVNMLTPSLFGGMHSVHLQVLLAFALAKICVSDMPDCFICVAEAERTLCALYRVVSIPALYVADSNHVANVDDWTGW